MNNLQNELNPLERLNAPTPKFFQQIRGILIMISAISAAIISAKNQGFILPSFFDILAEKATIISSLVGILISSFTVDFEKYKQQSDNHYK
jgi:hypothetical protein